MPSSAEAVGEEIVRTILALERSCLDADAALVERRWPDVESAFSAQSALTDRLGELFAAEPEHAPANDGRVHDRLRGVVAYREDQLRRLRAYRDEIGRRLRSIGRVRALSRTIGAPVTKPAFLDDNV